MKQVIVNVLNQETRIGILEDHVPVEFSLEREKRAFCAGNIYKGKVVDVLPGMEAAFVDIGDKKNAYLHVKDCYPPGKKISQCVQQGQELIVQIVKEGIGNKGAKVTCQISLAGQYCVYLPLESSIGISHRITDVAERERLTQLANEILSPEEGIIIRTQAQGTEKKELEWEMHFLRTRWKRGMEKGKKASPPVLLYEEFDLLTKLVRDLIGNHMDEIVVDNLEVARFLRSLLEQYPKLQKEKIKLYQGKEGIFSYYGLESEWNKAIAPRVWLKNGGYLVIDHTEALTVIDVNTGKFTGTDDLQRTVLRMNKEACYEIAKQLRLRDIGGMILIDFINLDREEDRQEILTTLKKALQKDRKQTQILGFTCLGLLELTRKRERENLFVSLTRECPCCHGRGRILSCETLAANLEREIREYGKLRDPELMVVEMHPNLIAYFERNQGLISCLQQELHLDLKFQARSDFREDQYEIIYIGKARLDL